MTLVIDHTPYLFTMW